MSIVILTKLQIFGRKIGHFIVFSPIILYRSSFFLKFYVFWQPVLMKKSKQETAVTEISERLLLFALFDLLLFCGSVFETVYRSRDTPAAVNEFCGRVSADLHNRSISEKSSEAYAVAGLFAVCGYQTHSCRFGICYAY